jgi:hypothetical protein
LPLLLLLLLLVPKLLQGATMIPPAVTAGVSRIFDSVVGALLLNPDRTFVVADLVSGVTHFIHPRTCG